MRLLRSLIYDQTNFLQFLPQTPRLVRNLDRVLTKCNAIISRRYDQPRRVDRDDTARGYSGVRGVSDVWVRGAV